MNLLLCGGRETRPALGVSRHWFCLYQILMNIPSLIFVHYSIRPTFKFNMLSNLFFTLKVNAWLVCLWVSCKDSSIGGIFQVMYTMLALCLPWMPSVAQIQIYPLDNEVCWSSTNWYLVGTWTGTYVLPTKLYMNYLLSSCFETVLHRSSLESIRTSLMDAYSNWFVLYWNRKWISDGST